MTDQTPEVKPDYAYQYQVDQQVSVSAYFEVDINGETVKFQVTSRYGATAEKIVKTTEAALTAYSMLRALHPKPEQPAAPAPVASAAPAATVAKPAETGVMSLPIKKIKVTPEVKDGKSRVLVDLFAEAHQWPDIKKYFDTPAQAAAAFSAVTSLDFSAAGEYSIDFIADYRNSEKLNSKGNPYKNLVNVRETPF